MVPQAAMVHAKASETGPSLDQKMDTKGSGSDRDDGLYLAVLQPQNYKITFIYRQIAHLEGILTPPPM